LVWRQVHQQLGRPSDVIANVGSDKASDNHAVQDHVITAGGEPIELVGQRSRSALLRQGGSSGNERHSRVLSPAPGECDDCYRDESNEGYRDEPVRGRRPLPILRQPRTRFAASDHHPHQCRSRAALASGPLCHSSASPHHLRQGQRRACPITWAETRGLALQAASQ
jgi:hypothetical protein